MLPAIWHFGNPAIQHAKLGLLTVTVRQPESFFLALRASEALGAQPSGITIYPNLWRLWWTGSDLQISANG